MAATFPTSSTGHWSGCSADAEADLDVVREWLPPEWDNTPPDEPALAYGTCAPSGWLALDLDSATTDPARLSDDTLIEAMIGFDRLASWAAARQARLLAELARRRPTDRAPYSARWAGVGSEYAPDEVGVALHLARGTACARVGLACRLLATLPETHALWETGQIDTAKARAIDDATWMLTSERARAVQARILDKAPEQTLAQLKAALARAVIAADPDGAEQRHRQARRDRRVVITPETDGMASLWALLTGALTPDLGHAESGHGRGSEMIHDHGPQELFAGVPAAGRRPVPVHAGCHAAGYLRGPRRVTSHAV